MLKRLFLFKLIIDRRVGSGLTRALIKLNIESLQLARQRDVHVHPRTKGPTHRLAPLCTVAALPSLSRW